MTISNKLDLEKIIEISKQEEIAQTTGINYLKDINPFVSLDQIQQANSSYSFAEHNELVQFSKAFESSLQEKLSANEYNFFSRYYDYAYQFFNDLNKFTAIFDTNSKVKIDLFAQKSIENSNNLVLLNKAIVDFTYKLNTLSDDNSSSYKNTQENNSTTITNATSNISFSNIYSLLILLRIAFNKLEMIVKEVNLMISRSAYEGNVKSAQKNLESLKKSNIASISGASIGIVTTGVSLGINLKTDFRGEFSQNLSVLSNSFSKITEDSMNLAMVNHLKYETEMYKVASEFANKAADSDKQLNAAIFQRQLDKYLREIVDSLTKATGTYFS